MYNFQYCISLINIFQYLRRKTIIGTHKIIPCFTSHSSAKNKWNFSPMFIVHSIAIFDQVQHVFFRKHKIFRLILLRKSWIQARIWNDWIFFHCSRLSKWFIRGQKRARSWVCCTLCPSEKLCKETGKWIKIIV